MQPCGPIGALNISIPEELDVSPASLYRIQGHVYAHLLRGLKIDRANQSGYNVHADGLRCVYFCAIVKGMVRHMARSKAILN
jgi:hypothetical protein